METRFQDKVAVLTFVWAVVGYGLYSLLATLSNDLRLTIAVLPPLLYYTLAYLALDWRAGMRAGSREGLARLTYALPFLLVTLYTPLLDWVTAQGWLGFLLFGMTALLVIVGGEAVIATRLTAAALDERRRFAEHWRKLDDLSIVDTLLLRFPAGRVS